MIVYEHTFPVSLMVATLATALILGAFTAWKFLPHRLLNFVLFLLYALILLGTGWCLLLPGYKNALTQLRKPRFIVALDTSQSMNLTPSPDVPTRWATAQEALRRPWLSSLAADCDIEIFPFASELGENVAPADVASLKPDGTATRLRDTLKKIADRSAGLNVAGMLLLSDVQARGSIRDFFQSVAQPRRRAVGLE